MIFHLFFKYKCSRYIKHFFYSDNVLITDFLCTNCINRYILLYSTYLFVAFGFCEFADQESTLRALRLLSGLSLGGKKLVIKVADKSKPQFMRYIENSKRAKQGLSPLPELSEVLVYRNTVLISVIEYSILSLVQTPGDRKSCSPYPEFVLTVFVITRVYCIWKYCI